jgi:diguanylate cyclase (GGDEF)-like protein
MNTQRKLAFVSLVAISIAFVVLIGIVTYSFRTLSTKTVMEKASVTAELVKDGLTAHMLTGTTEHRDFFLDKIENSKNVDELWLARAPSVVNQYGTGFNNEIPRDSIDKKVIETGEVYHHLNEDITDAKLRMTIPYKATAFGNPNCLDCHEASEGETLGTISMVFDITGTRNESILTILYIMGVSIVVMGLVLWALHYSLRPFMQLFSSINSVMEHAQEGDYTKRVNAHNAHGDGRQVAEWINSFLDKLEGTLSDIQLSAKNFFLSERSVNHDPLLNTKHVINEMADIYRFKKTIEFDENKPQVYERLATVLRHHFNVDEFKLVEANTQTDSVYEAYSCESVSHALAEDCRALRTKQPVFSDQFKDICTTCQKASEHYICVPYTISDDFELLLHFAPKDEETLSRIKTLLPQIENFIDAARPELVSKNLTEILRLSSTTDQLTGLYNRKFLDEFVDKAVSQALRASSTYAILMLDIDFFKVVNDTYGHDVGDRAIEMLARVIKGTIREADVAFRYGGEEFLIMLYNCDAAKVDKIANAIRTNFSKETIQAPNGKSFSKTLSIGYSLFPTDAEAIWRCIKFADVALYKAKDTGRNKVVRFDISMLGEGELNETYNPKSKKG